MSGGPEIETQPGAMPPSTARSDAPGEVPHASGRRQRVRALAASAGGIAVGSAVGAVLPFVLARTHGVGRDTDVYFIVLGAVQIAAYLVGLVVESAALPVFARSTTRRPDAARPLLVGVARQLMPLCVAVDVAALVAVAALVLPLSGVDLVGDDRGIVYLACTATLPFLAAMSGLAAAANYSLQRYAWTTASQAFRAGTALLALLLAPSEYALPATAAGICVGELLRGLLLWATLPRADGPRVEVPHSVGRDILGLAGPTLVSSAIIAVNPIIDRAVAAHVGHGAPTVLELAEKIYYIPSVLLVAAVSKVYTAQWARVAADDPGRIRPDYLRVQSACLVVGSVAAAVVGVSAPFLMGTVLQGRLGVVLPAGFTLILVMFMFGLPFAMSSDLSNSVLIILRQARVMPAIALALVALNIVADLAGAHLFGVAGVAAASSVVRCASACAAGFFAWRHLRSLTPADAR